MTLTDYIISATRFANMTKNWGALDTYKEYVALEHGEWTETCDNHEGGIPIDWAFHKGEEEVKQDGAWYFWEYIQNLLQVGVDDEWDKEGWVQFAKQFI